jgi:hypothetical protein
MEFPVKGSNDPPERKRSDRFAEVVRAKIKRLSSGLEAIVLGPCDWEICIPLRHVRNVRYYIHTFFEIFF